MAEIETKRLTEKKKRFNKKSTRVDLTPMVDLGFLLLTFFVFTSRLKEPMVMDLLMPYDKTPVRNEVCESCVLTVLLDEGNSIKYYEGAASENPMLNETVFSAAGIRQVLMNKKNAVANTRRTGDAFVLIIKASPKSNFKNFVDITDEVTICGIRRYYIDELNEVDKKMLLKK